ncbi:MAG TPA: Gfo/Idh/MocA family oxidoreductase [Anaerohalosphaeraceae bacterium]|jgi:predicted dehydrogenase|nr:Gfo/Idh/MocA family oxidoreductase [Anaerohalosphaeraceae bacterium]HRT51117.1 Gfo/Idh/MocA family oxidoreductase [Anaerohalosphaeraceae bacterium]HRT87132.1 Gfo/Idh/MocA family oxidoreductase [Anaerohalosphaeraceae bacterium]
MSIDRRSFVKGTLASGMSFMVAPSLLRAKAGTKYRTVVIGSGWWGMNIATVAIESGRCELAALCDVDTNQLDPAATRVEKLTGRAPKKYKDFRECLAQERPDIAIVATPDHWHPLCTIAAVEAGAHVYVEKPIGHTVCEGRAMVKAARANNRVVQVGTHRRVSPHNVSGMKFLKEGGAGDIGMVRCFVHYGGGPGQVTPDSEPPAGLDWDMWCGPGPLRPFNRRIHPRGFRRFLDYANGQLGDWGIHWLDQVLWWTEEKWPKAVSSVAARHILRDNTDCPDTQVVQYEFESFTCTWEHRLYAANNAEKHNIGAYFYGTKGTFHMGWQDGWTFYPASGREAIRHEDPQLDKPDDQNIRGLWADFLSCIETGRRPVCDIEIGHRSTNMALLGMLSYKVGRSIRWDGEKEVIIGDPEANKLLKREYRKPWVYPA